MKLDILISLHFLCFSVLALGQGKKDEDLYIEHYKDKLVTKVSVSNDFEFFELLSENQNLVFVPNINQTLKAGVSYRWLSLSMDFQPGYLIGTKTDDLKGRSRYYQFKLYVHTRRILQNFSLQRYKGFYLGNSAELGLSTEEKPFVVYPELIYRTISGYTAYRVNRNFSLKALSAQTEKQLQSAGTLLPVLNYRIYSIGNQSELMPNESTQKVNSFECVFQLSYLYTYVFRQNWYASAGLGTGAGITLSEVTTRFFDDPQMVSIHRNPHLRWAIELEAGYSTPRLFGGVQFKAGSDWMKQKGTSTSLVRNEFMYQIFVGYRFGAPVLLEKVFDKVSFWE